MPKSTPLVTFVVELTVSLNFTRFARLLLSRHLALRARCSTKQYPHAAKKFCLQGVTIRFSEETDAHKLVRESLELNSFATVKVVGTSDDGLLCIAKTADGDTVNERVVAAGLGFVRSERAKRSERRGAERRLMNSASRYSLNNVWFPLRGARK